MSHSFRKKNTERCVASVRGGLFQDQHVVALGILICCAIDANTCNETPTDQDQG